MLTHRLPTSCPPAGHSRPTTILLKEFDTIAAHLLQKVRAAQKEQAEQERRDEEEMGGAMAEAQRMRAAEQAAAVATAIVTGALDGAVPMDLA